ncbi:hypothetical protein PInf_008490 [Phytophthora infestans]|nr:hypothetical protein PInf_008490 [Phytophthora infestans]
MPSIVLVHGLKGVDYFNKVAKVNTTETREYIDLANQTDNVYSNAPNKLSAIIKGVNAMDRTGDFISSSSIQKSNIEMETDAVAWNSWAERAKALEDFSDEEYKSRSTVEPGRVSVKQVLPAVQTYTLQENISVTILLADADVNP